MVRSSVRPIVRPFVRPNNLFSYRYAAEIQIVRSFDHSIVHRSFIVPIHRPSFVHSPYSSFFQIIFVLPLCCWNSDRSFVRSFDRLSFVHSSYSSFIVRSWSLFIVLPDNLCPAIMLSKFRSFVRPIIRSFVRSFIVPIHRSFIVPIHRSSFVHTTIHHHYSPLLFIITIHWHYSPSLLFIITIHHRYYLSSLLLIDDI
jgi:hypothetical protein